MALVDVLSEKDIEQLGQQLRGLLDGGHLSREAIRVLEQLRENKIRVQGKVGPVELDLTLWAEKQS
jgi:hypothetical protein